MSRDVAEGARAVQRRGVGRIIAIVVLMAGLFYAGVGPAHAQAAGGGEASPSDAGGGSKLSVGEAGLSEQVTILNPVNGGTLTSSPRENPPHHTFVGDWAADIALGGAQPAYARFGNATGALALTITGTGTGCSGGGGGLAVRVQVSVDGVDLGYVWFLHFASLARTSGAIANGELLGTQLTGPSQGANCWTGPHIHVEPYQSHGYSCFVNRGIGSAVPTNGAIGVLGGNYASGKNATCPAGAESPAIEDPVGAFDVVDSPRPGRVHVRGWSFDPSASASPVTIHVYVGGQAGPSAEGHNIGAAGGSRPDVGLAYPGVGDNHGFDTTFSTDRYGTQQVCVYGINIGAGSNALIQCKSVNIANPNPFGSFDTVRSNSPGRIHVRGWSIDPNRRTTPVIIHVYVGGQASAANEGHNTGPADRYRRDVGAAVPGAGNHHGFDVGFTTSRRGTQQVCVYGIDVGPGTNTLIGCKTVAISG